MPLYAEPMKGRVEEGSECGFVVCMSLFKNER